MRFKTFMRRPEGFFLCTSMLFGGVFLLIMPPIQTPDEASHFLRAYEVSQLEIVPKTQNRIVGANLPVSLSKTIHLFDSPSLRFYPNVKYDIHRTAAALHMPLNKNTKMFTSGVAAYAPIGYIPQAIGIFIGSIFNAPVVVLMYIARLASLCTWTALVFMAIMIAPNKKWAFAGLGLLPMLVAQAISPGIDAISVGLGVLFIASVLKLRELPKIELKWWVCLLSIACLIALTKQTTLVVLGFLFLLKLKQFDTDRLKAIAKKTGILIIPLVIYIIWGAMTASLVSSSVIVGQNSSEQTSLIIHHPLRFPHVIFNTFFTTWGDDVIRSFIGDFGWVDTPLPGVVVNMGYIFIAALLFINYESIKKKLSRADRYLIVTLIGLYIIGTCAALYIFYSPVGYPAINGLQGRYFLLFLFMAILLFVGVQLRISQEHYARLVKVGTILLLFASVLTLYLRYYVKLF